MQKQQSIYDFDTFFQSFAACKNYNYGLAEKKLYYGLSFSPVFHYNLRFDFKNGALTVLYEIRATSPDTPGATIGSFGDRHTCTINCNIFSAALESDFYVVERSIFKKLVSPRPHKHFSVKTKDEALHAYLMDSNYLNEIFKIVDNSAEFSPSVKGGKTKELNEAYEITIMYGGAKEMNIEKLALCIEFCKSMMNYN